MKWYVEFEKNKMMKFKNFANNSRELLGGNVLKSRENVRIWKMIYFRFDVITHTSIDDVHFVILNYSYQVICSHQLDLFMSPQLCSQMQPNSNLIEED